jgi:bacterioferritin-associated ferredoxin
MYVCLCHGITDGEIRRYRERGVAPKCGKCVATVRAILSANRALIDGADCGPSMACADMSAVAIAG